MSQGYTGLASENTIDSGSFQQGQNVGSLPLRFYQIEAIQAAESAWSRGVLRPAEVLPTGTGKTVVIAHLAQRWRDRIYAAAHGRRVLILVHRTELVDQTVEKLRDVAPHLSIGIVRAEQNETRCDVIVASVQTLANEQRRLMIADVGLIVVDECHHAVAATWLAVLRHYGAWGDEFRPSRSQPHAAKAIGFTATLTRADKKALGDVWQEVVYVRGIGEMVRLQYLVRPRGIQVKVADLDLSTVKQSRGDYQAGDLGRAITESQAPEAVVRAIGEHCPDRPGLVFTPTVESARVMVDYMTAANYRTAMVWGAMPRDVRKRVLDDYKAGQLDWLVNPQVLTEGTDLPRAAVAVIARPTNSAGLFVQMAGRVLRPYPGKREALLLDIVGATARHSLHATMSLFGEEAAEEARKQEGEDVEQIEDDELSIAGALGLEDAELFVPERVSQLISSEVDLFAGSSSAWLRTRGGIWFLPAGSRYIAIIPGVQHGTYDITAMDAKTFPTFDHLGNRVSGTGHWIATGIHELGYAMAWAEADVTRTEKMTASRERQWRLDRPNEKQINYARRLGNIVPPQATKGEVSEMITLSLASQRIDPFVPAYARGR